MQHCTHKYSPTGFRLYDALLNLHKIDNSLYAMPEAMFGTILVYDICIALLLNFSIGHFDKVMKLLHKYLKLNI